MQEKHEGGVSKGAGNVSGNVSSNVTGNVSGGVPMDMSEGRVSRKLVSKSAVRIVELDRLGVDVSYQREEKAGHKRIVAEYMEEALGVPLVGEREDGTLWIVDGLQRITALRKLGKRTVRAEIFNSRGAEHEAMVFKAVNLNRTKLTSAEEFQALLTGHDALAWRIKETVEAAGYRLYLKKKKGSRPKREDTSRDLSCVTTLLRVMKVRGADALTFALRVLAEAWPGDGLNTHHLIIDGLTALYTKNDRVVDEGRLVSRMRTSTPHKVMYTASQMTIAGNRVSAVTEVLERLYRKRMSSYKRDG